MVDIDSKYYGMWQRSQIALANSETKLKAVLGLVEEAYFVNSRDVDRDELAAILQVKEQ